MRKKLILIGAGGHAKVVIDAIAKEEYEIVGILDKDTHHLHQKINDIEIIGCDKQAIDFYNSGVDCAFIAIGHIGNPHTRHHIFSRLKQMGFHFINIVHPTAVVSTSSKLGQGNLVMAGSIINADACIEDNNIINTGAIIEHDVIIKNGVHIAPGGVISGSSIINDNTFIGAGSTIIQGIQIGKNTIIGAGSVVVHDIPDNVVAVGCPAHIIKHL